MLLAVSKISQIFITSAMKYRKFVPILQMKNKLGSIKLLKLLCGKNQNPNAESGVLEKTSFLSFRIHYK